MENGSQTKTRAVLAFIIGYITFSLLEFPFPMLNLPSVYLFLTRIAFALAPAAAVIVAVLINRRNKNGRKVGALVLSLYIIVTAIGGMCFNPYAEISATPSLNWWSVLIAAGGAIVSIVPYGLEE